MAALIFAYNMVYSYFKGPDAGPGPLGRLDARADELIAAA